MHAHMIASVEKRRIAIVLVLRFPAFIYIISYTSRIHRRTKDPFLRKANGVETFLPFPSIREWLSWQPIFIREEILLLPSKNKTLVTLVMLSDIIRSLLSHSVTIMGVI